LTELWRADLDGESADTLKFSVDIDAFAFKVWDVITIPSMMVQWIGEPEMKLEVITSWEVSGPIVIRGYHHVWFENKGTVLALEPNKLLRYTHLSSVSRLPDKPESYTTLEFRLDPITDSTRLTLTISNFPTESIFKHHEFYWKGTLVILKKLVETRNI
jgi:uncharacterized protein YndB with AHSA1/START domain